MPDMNEALGVIEKLESQARDVHQQRCVRVRNRNAQCRQCLGVCPVDAISIADNQLTIDGQRCTGCGACSTVCPTCALEARRPNDAELFAQCLQVAAKAEGQVVVVCQRFLDQALKAVDSQKVLCVSCVARIEESTLVRLAQAGVGKVTLFTGACKDCDQSGLQETIELVASTASALLEIWNSPCTVTASLRLPRAVALSSGRGYDESRRNFFGAVREGAKDMAMAAAAQRVESVQQQKAAPVLMKVMADGTLPHFEADRRERLLAALIRMGEPQDTTLKVRLWNQVRIDSTVCEGCRMCTAFCPTGALSKLDGPDGFFGVEQALADCVACGCCQDVCRTGALKLDPQVGARAIHEGRAESISMPKPAKPRGGSSSILNAMTSIFKNPYVYQR